jgi:hypothetical protein
MTKKTCTNCSYYHMNGREKRGMMNLDFCIWHQKPLRKVEPFFNNVFYSKGAYLDRGDFNSLEERAENCPFYNQKTRG